MQGTSLKLLALALLVFGTAARAEDAAPKPKYTEEELKKFAATLGQTNTLIEPFTPPSLEELDKSVEWIDGPVLDGMELLKAQQAKEKPLATVAEALKLRNRSPQDNAKILSALGRLPDDQHPADEEAEISRYTPEDVKSIIGILSSSVTEADLSGLTGFGLFSFDWRLEPFAAKDSVARWQFSKDRMYDKVVLRDDLTWSDGRPITAHDVVFSYRTLMNPDVPVPAQRTGTDEIKWVEAYDDRTLVFFHKAPLATNVWNVNFSIVPKHAFQDVVLRNPRLSGSPEVQQLEEHPVCGGPYVVKQRKLGQEILLERRESYYMHDGKQVRDKPYFKTVRFKVLSEINTAFLALKAAQIDDMLLSPELWLQADDDAFYKRNVRVRGTEWTEFHFIWNCKSPWFADKRVRWAMTYAFDHKECLETTLQKLNPPAVGPFHPESAMAPKNPPQPVAQDLDKAEELLDEAGWTDSDGDGVRDKVVDGKKVNFEFTMLTYAIPVRIEICKLLKQNLDQIGIRMNIKALEPVAMQKDLLEHNFDAAHGGWGAGADPDTSSNIYVTKEGRNYGQYSNKQVDALFKAGKEEFDRDKRMAVYGKIHLLLWDDQPYTWIYTRDSFYAFNKNVRGYRMSPRGPFHYSPGFGSIYKSPTMQ